MSNPGPFLFIIMFISVSILQKNCILQHDSNWDCGVEDKHADHLTPTPTAVLKNFYDLKILRKMLLRFEEKDRDSEMFSWPMFLWNLSRPWKEEQHGQKKKKKDSEETYVMTIKQWPT